MKPIKFRGRDIDTGEFVYAELGQVSAELSDEYLSFITDDMHLVDEDSVAQLVGVDKNGKEIYEGDTLTNESGDIMTACLLDGVISEVGFAHDFPLELLTLKEDSK